MPPEKLALVSHVSTKRYLGTAPQCLYMPARQRLALRKNAAAAQQLRQAHSSPASGVPRFLATQPPRPQRHASRSPVPLGLHEARNIWHLPPRSSQWRGMKTIQQAEARQKLGPFSMVSAFTFVAAGVGLYFYFTYEKERMERKRIAEATKGVGKPKVGGSFELVDQDGNTWRSGEKMDGKFSLVYFGFSHCPDICPEELDKMAEMLDVVGETIPPSRGNPNLLPIFITCDPARDTPAVLKTYLKEFHPSIVGLTGAWEQIKAVCKLYRVYFSTPSGVKPGQDYLVDHSIYFYLMDPEGDFVEAIGRQHTAEQGAKLIIDHMSDWRGKVRRE